MYVVNDQSALFNCIFAAGIFFHFFAFRVPRGSVIVLRWDGRQTSMAVESVTEQRKARELSADNIALKAR